MKKCSKCGQIKQSIDFYTHKTNQDRLSGSCKQCCVDYNKKRGKILIKKRRGILISEGSSYKKTNNSKREYHRKWAKKNKKHVSAYKKEYSKNRKNEESARYKLGTAVFYGKIKRPMECSKCGDVKGVVEGHHTDYLQPYNVIWLCKSCHKKEHRRIAKNGRS